MAWVWIVVAVMFIAGAACIIIGTALGRPLRVALRERRTRIRGTVGGQATRTHPPDGADSPGPHEG